jgi:hypothetical protein
VRTASVALCSFTATVHADDLTARFGELLDIVDRNSESKRRLAEMPPGLPLRVKKAR